MCGLTHRRYGHSARPSLLHVLCPSCGARADARKASEDPDVVLVGDLSPGWNLADWNVTCQRCPFRLPQLAYADLPPLFYRIDRAGVELWAWNRDHLVFLEAYLSSRDVSDHPLRWLGAYVKGEWKEKGRRGRLAAVIREHLTADAAP